MAKKLTLVNGIPRMVDESASPAIYDEYIDIVISGASGDNQLNGPISAGVGVSLPDSGTYESHELEVYLSGQRLEDIIDYAYVGPSGTRTDVAFTFDLEVGDRIRFRVDRGA